MRVALSDERRKILEAILHSRFYIFKMLSAFRYQKVVVSFPPFER